MKLAAAVVSGCLTMALTGCGVFTQQVVDPEAVDKKREAVTAEERYRAGFESGYEAARAELTKKLAEDAEAMKALKIYRAMIYEGAMAPPEVVVVHRPEQLSPDGQRYSPAGMEAVIRRPARFVSREALNGLLAKGGRSQLFGVFPDKAAADAAVATLSNKKAPEDTVSVLTTPDGRYAVYVVSNSGTNYFSRDEN